MLLFETERLLVKRFTENDAAHFFALNGDPEVVKFIRPVKSREECDAFLQENIRLYQDGSLIGRYAVYEKSSLSFVGSYAFLYLKGEADYHTGYALIRDAWGKGYATELVKGGIPYFFSHTPHSSLYAIIDRDNSASQQVLLKAGMAYCGLLEENGKSLGLFSVSREEFAAGKPNIG